MCLNSICHIIPTFALLYNHRYKDQNRGSIIRRFARRSLFLRDRLQVCHQRQKATKDKHECDGGEDSGKTISNTQRLVYFFIFAAYFVKYQPYVKTYLSQPSIAPDYHIGDRYVFPFEGFGAELPTRQYRLRRLRLFPAAAGLGHRAVSQQPCALPYVHPAPHRRHRQ